MGNNFPRKSVSLKDMYQKYKKRMEKTFAKRYWPTIVGAIVGAIGGYLYWRYVGCSTDTCPITSSPLNSTLWGTAMGGLLGNILQPNIIKKNNQNK